MLWATFSMQSLQIVGLLNMSVIHFNCICAECSAWLFAVHQPGNTIYFRSPLTGSSVTLAISGHYLQSKVDWRTCRWDPAPKLCVNAPLPRFIGMSEKTPLLNYRFRGGAKPEPCHEAETSAAKLGGDGRKLGVLFGVVVPTLLSMFSVVVFLRIGELKSQIFLLLLLLF